MQKQISCQLLLLLASLATVCHAYPACPEGWLGYRESCYQFNKHFLSWFDAADKCRQQGAHLVTVDDVQENNYIVSHLQSVELSKYFAVVYYRANNNNNFYGYDFSITWIGYTDLYQEGTWQWIDSDSTGTFTNWDVNRPDNWNNGDHCAHYGHPVSSMKWNDASCNLLGTFICEI